MNHRKNTLPMLALLAALLIASWCYLFSYTEPPVDPAWMLLPVEEIPAGAVSVRYSGTATLLFSDGETQWMIDGWFSRPGPLALMLGKIEPDRAAIDFGLAANGLALNDPTQNGYKPLAAVIPMHSHYDHAMDAPEVALRTGATLIGSTATANIARGWSLPERQIRVVENNEKIALGAFSVTFIESRHFQFPDPKMVESLLANPAIATPLVPPVSARDYKLGKAYVLHVAHPKGSFLVVGSAGFVPGQLAGLDVDVVFLGVGALGSQTSEYREQFWHETVGQVSPQRIIPIHWDSLTGPLDAAMTGEVRIARFLSGGAEQTLAFLKAKEAADPNVPLQTLPRFKPVVLFR